MTPCAKDDEKPLRETLSGAVLCAWLAQSALGHK
jgi:hypothetical protein